MLFCWTFIPVIIAFQADLPQIELMRSETSEEKAKQESRSRVFAHLSQVATEHHFLRVVHFFLKHDFCHVGGLH